MEAGPSGLLREGLAVSKNVLGSLEGTKPGFVGKQARWERISVRVEGSYSCDVLVIGTNLFLCPFYEVKLPIGMCIGKNVRDLGFGPS